MTASNHTLVSSLSDFSHLRRGLSIIVVMALCWVYIRAVKVHYLSRGAQNMELFSSLVQ
jgi:hypothetical protein